MLELAAACSRHSTKHDPRNCFLILWKQMFSPHRLVSYLHKLLTHSHEQLAWNGGATIGNCWWCHAAMRAIEKYWHNGEGQPHRLVDSFWFCYCGCDGATGRIRLKNLLVLQVMLKLHVTFENTLFTFVHRPVFGLFPSIWPVSLSWQGVGAFLLRSIVRGDRKRWGNWHWELWWCHYGI